MANEIMEEYKSSLADLTFNSKPLINMLTMLAEENSIHAAEIVRVIQVHINQAKPSHSLPCLYLIDSIVKNIPNAGNYKSIIAQEIVPIFVSVFEKVDEKTRQSMHKLRLTWSEIFPNSKMYALDLRVQQIDPAWPTSAKSPESPISTIHVNPKFLKKQSENEQRAREEQNSDPARQDEILRQRIKEEERARLLEEERARIQEEERKRLLEEERMRKDLMSKQQELMKLQQQRLELELAEARAKLEQQTQQFKIKEQLLIQSVNKQEDMLTKGSILVKKDKEEPKTREDPRLAANRDPRRAARDSKEKRPTATTSKTAKVKTEPDAARPSSSRWSELSGRSSKGSTPSKSSTKRKTEFSQGSPVRNRKEGSSNSKAYPWVDDADDSRATSPPQNAKSSASREFQRKEKKNSLGRRQYRSNRRSESPATESTSDPRDPRSYRARSPVRRSPAHDEDSRDSLKSGRPRDSDRDRKPKEKSNKAEGDKPLPRNFARRGGKAGRSGRDDPKSATATKEESKRNAKTIDISDDEDVRPPTKKHRNGKETTKRARVKDELRDDPEEHVPQYKKLPPIPKLNMRQKAESGGYLASPSPSAEGWAKFKAARPDDFPYASQPRRTLLPSPDVSTADGKPLLLDSAGDILIQAEEQLKSGKLTPEQHQDLLVQLTELYKLQKVKEQLREKRESMDSQVGGDEPSRPDAKAVAAKAAYEEHATKLRAALQTNAGRQMGRGGRSGPPSRDPRVGRGPTGPDPAFGPRGSRDGPYRGPPRGLEPGYGRGGGPPFGPRGGPYRHRYPTGIGVNRPMDSWEPLEYPWYDLEEFYVPQHDARWLFKAKEQEGDSEVHDLVFDGSRYALPINKSSKVPIDEQNVDVRIDPETQEVLFGDVCYYKIGDFERDVVINGNTHTVFLQGPLKNIWIDDIQYEINIDSPPIKIVLGEKEHEIRIDSFSNRVFVDGYDVCPYGGETQIVKLAFVEHEIKFHPPPKHILIDGKLRELNVSAPFPFVVINGKRYGIRFDGPPREVMIDNKPWTVRVDEPRKCRFSGGRPRLLALGGPGHELIIDNHVFELKFGGQEKYVRCGERVHRVQLLGSPPEVKILGEMKTLDEIYEIAGPTPPEYTSSEGRMLGYGTPRGPKYRYPQPRNVRAPIRGPMGRHPGPMGPRDPRFIHRGPPMRPPMMGPPIPPPLGPMPPQPNMMRPPMNYQPPLQQPAPAANAPNMDVNDLLSKLVSAGLIGNKDNAKPANEEEKKNENTEAPKSVEPEKKTEETIDPDEEGLTETQKLEKQAKLEETNMEALPNMDLEPKNLKTRSMGVIQRLYVGVQCSSCGTRFTSEHISKYQEHLDWHFRQNRREKDEMKVAKFRRWYYGVADWIQYEEISHEEEKQSNFFDMYQSEFSYNNEAPPEIISCPAASGNKNDDVCDVCREKFEQFFDEEAEEWHLKDAIRVKNKTYHPVCYEDVKDNPSEASTPAPTPSQTPAETPTTSSTDLIDPITNPLAYLNRLNAMRANDGEAQGSGSKDASPAAGEKAENGAKPGTEPVTSTPPSQPAATPEPDATTAPGPDPAPEAPAAETAAAGDVGTEEPEMTMKPELIVVQPPFKQEDNSPVKDST